MAYQKILVLRLMMQLCCYGLMKQKGLLLQLKTRKDVLPLDWSSSLEMAFLNASDITSLSVSDFENKESYLRAAHSKFKSEEYKSKVAELDKLGSRIEAGKK